MSSNATLPESSPITDAITAATLNSGQSLAAFTSGNPTLVLFLRHFGCTFCREAVTDIASQEEKIRHNGVDIVLVHMGTEDDALNFFEHYGLLHVPRVSDPELDLYRAFGLGRASLGQAFGPRVWMRGASALLSGGYGIGRVIGDGFQMPGVFLVENGGVVRSYYHRRASDRPDYLNFCCVVPA